MCVLKNLEIIDLFKNADYLSTSTENYFYFGSDVLIDKIKTAGLSRYLSWCSWKYAASTLVWRISCLYYYDVNSIRNYWPSIREKLVVIFQMDKKDADNVIEYILLFLYFVKILSKQKFIN